MPYAVRRARQAGATILAYLDQTHPGMLPVVVLALLVVVVAVVVAAIAILAAAITAAASGAVIVLARRAVRAGVAVRSKPAQ